MSAMKILVLAACIACACAIVRRHDVADSKYVHDPSEYPAIMILNNDDDSARLASGRKLMGANGGGGFNADCGATLVDKKFAITAAHCICGQAKKGYSVKIGNPRKSSKVVASHVQTSGCVFNCKHGGEPNKCDVALVELETDVTGVTPYPVYHGNDEVGKTMHFCGWGVPGDAKTIKSKTCDDGDEDGKFRCAENVVTKAKGVIEYVMDKPSDGALPLEGIMASGDSGSPGMLTFNNVTYVVGVDSGSDDNNGCKYGSTDQLNRLTEQYEWIQSVISGNAANTPNTTTVNLLPMGYMRQY